MTIVNDIIHKFLLYCEQQLCHKAHTCLHLCGKGSVFLHVYLDSTDNQWLNRFTNCRIFFSTELSSGVEKFFFLIKSTVLQDCIPVGCVPPASVAVPGGWGSPPGTPSEEAPRRKRHPPVNRMTNRCKNITLPQTSFACGKSW